MLIDSTSAGATVGPRCRLSAFASRSVAGALAIALVGTLIPGAALAQPAPAAASTQREPTPAEMEVAKRSFEDGVRFYNEGNYDAARAQFEAAYKLSRFPALLYNLGKTAEKQNQRRDAIRFLEQYLLTKPQDAPEVEAKLQVLRKAEGLPEDGSAPPSSGTGTGTGTGTAPPPVNLLQSKWLVGTQKLPPIPSLALLGAGAGFLIIGIGCGAGALSAARELENSNGKPYAGDVSATFDRGRALNDAAIAFDVLGGVMLAGGGAWLGYWVYKRLKHPETLPQASLVPTGTGMAVIGSF